MAISPTSIVVHESVPARTLKEFIEYARANPSKLSYGSAGAGTMTNLSGELFKELIGVKDITHIPYKGSAPGVADLACGPHPDDDAERRRTAPAIPCRKARSASSRSPRTSGWRPRPTSRPPMEAGLPGMVAANFNGLFAPAGVPKDIIKMLADETRAAMADPQVAGPHDQVGFRAGARFRARSRTAGSRERVRPLDADHQEARIQSAMTGELPMDRRDVLKLALPHRRARSPRRSRWRKADFRTGRSSSWCRSRLAA